MNLQFENFQIFLLLLCQLKFGGGASTKVPDLRWSKELDLPEDEVARIQSHLHEINYFLYDHSKQEWVATRRSDPIPENLWQRGNDVKLIVHGYTFKHFQNTMEKLDEQFILHLSNEYVKYNSSLNVVMVDWTILSTESLRRYYEASMATKYVGEEIAKYLVDLVKQSYTPGWDNVHIIGFSLGGQTVGVIGDAVQKLVGQKIGRITGIDPAGPNFERDGKLLNDLSRVLDKSDGKFVDVIHCNMRPPDKSFLGRLGTYPQSGHADFYPDGGEHQLNCSRKDDMGRACSHLACPQYMAESLTRPTLACPCKDWSNYQKGDCMCTLETGGKYLGEPCDTNASGQYYVLMSTNIIKIVDNFIKLKESTVKKEN